MRPRPEHPRPDFVRGTHWQSLNGLWNFAFDQKDEGLLANWNKDLPLFQDKQIQVPWVHQTFLSGINERRDCSVVWYQRNLSPSNVLLNEKEDEILLHFGAVDYQSSVWVDGNLCASHRGGHTPFSANITSQFREAAKQKRDLSIVGQSLRPGFSRS